MLSCSAPVDASGNATCSVFASMGSLGTRNWIATYSGDANYYPATSAPASHTIVRESEDFAVDADEHVGDDAACHVHGCDQHGRFGPDRIDHGRRRHVELHDADHRDLGLVQRRFAHAGARQLMAAYAGDTLHAPATSPAITQTVTPASTHIAIFRRRPISLPNQPVSVTRRPRSIRRVGVPPGTIAVSGDGGAATWTIAASGGSCNLR